MTKSNGNATEVAYADAITEKIPSDKIHKIDRVAHGEDTPAYAALQSYGLLNTSFRKGHFDDIFEENDLKPNSSHSRAFLKRLAWGVHWTPGCGWMLYNTFNTEVTVPPGCVCCFTNSENEYLFARPGVHAITDPFLKKVGFPTLVPATGEVIRHGNRVIVTIPQGRLGYATDMGQPVLLPPGLHSWKSETLRYECTYSLDDHVIEVGPYTILTVDEGYAAITQNNGKQVVLDGGHTHLLSHQKWKFEKFITKKIQTNELQSIKAASADNVIMSVSSTVVWRIKDVRVAATMAAETMSSSGGRDAPADLSKLRNDVLKQAIASLAGFIGSVNYSDSFHVAAAAQRHMATAEATVVGSENEPSGIRNVENPMFDTAGMSEAVSHANQTTNKFGVEITSINIISANPVDAQLTASLATGAVASAEALQAETQARGMAKAAKIEADAAATARQITAESEASATVVKAKADGEAKRLIAEGDKAAEVLRAEGSKQAANLLESSAVAVKLETMKASALSLKSTDKFFFGQEPSYMSNVVMRGPESVAAIDE
mmetsp:Transcript_7285/g.9910  ORF Transcript_7285/g.9910 Transcript_7285/m.9910 type:complete len:546 (-) Transcript_7285:197-1834(-)|eukprot:CAMPEP_0185726824 /NCGR_PEP_ID=MMETSP1171-20130828/2681_1 /TAXON_ID=374046 /ORGANISM="Helicotheca tamensis, Strain CCMP826" /LENGTH=545 /DNA_ID=CAMNT_0028395245 /DNA_START=17 /DNA_END=1654 /DNA_ORIENTATION=-